jgi:tetrathionate reductase subunit B
MTMKTPTSDGRRVFLKKLLGGAAAAGAVMIYRQPAMAYLRGDAKSGQGTDGSDYAFVVDVNKCIGCGNCVRACSTENNVPEGQYRTWIERYVITADGVYVDSPNGGKDGFQEVPEELRGKAQRSFFVPKLCNHCKNAPCVQVCPVGATFRSKEGFVLVDPKYCIGCGYCVQACPYGVRFINSERHIADKCTWCYHRVEKGLLPACVTVCPTQARTFGELDDRASSVAQVYKTDEWKVLKPAMHTQCMTLYLGLPREVV